MALVYLIFAWLPLFFISSASILVERAVSNDLLSTFKLYEQYAAASYCNGNSKPGSSTKVTCPAGNCPLVQAANAETVVEFENSLITDVTGFVAVDSTNKLIVVSFRGSVSIQNFIADANFLLVPIDICNKCLGMGGFWQSWQEARYGVLNAVEAAATNNPTFKIVATGHSLGGAIASFAAADLRNAGYVVDLATFGSPRIGDAATAQYITNQAPMKGQNFRVTHYNDPVPRLPPTAFGFSHISPEYYISTGNGRQVSSNDIQVYTGLNSKNGNGAWIWQDIFAHAWYFNSIAACL